MTDKKKIVTNLDLDDIVFATAKKKLASQSRITKCRLINPTKPELRKVSQKKLTEIVVDVKKKSLGFVFEAVQICHCHCPCIFVGQVMSAHHS